MCGQRTMTGGLPGARRTALVRFCPRASADTTSKSLEIMRKFSEQYAKYVAEVRRLSAPWKSRYIVRSRPVEVLEGSPEEWGDYLLLVAEWPSAEAARTFWSSPEYRRVRELRAGAGEVHVVLAEELPPPPGAPR